MKMKWAGVMPATTTAFDEQLNIDHTFVARHANWLIDHGCSGIVTPGSLGESATLSFDEKLAVWNTVIEAVGERVPVVAAIAALSTAEAVRLAQKAADVGCSGLMVLPPYVYRSDWREMKPHIEAVFRATKLSCMLYNNPVAYGTDFLPHESVDLFNYAMKGEKEKAIELYRWFLPLLRMDTVPKFVQLIKLVQEEVGMGNARVRPPRLELVGEEREEALKVIRHAITHKPKSG